MLVLISKILMMCTQILWLNTFFLWITYSLFRIGSGSQTTYWSQVLLMGCFLYAGNLISSSRMLNNQSVLVFNLMIDYVLGQSVLAANMSDVCARTYLA